MKLIALSGRELCCLKYISGGGPLASSCKKICQHLAKEVSIWKMPAYYASIICQHLIKEVSFFGICQHSLLSDNATSNAKYATMPNVHMFYIFGSKIIILRVILHKWHWLSNANYAFKTKSHQFMNAMSPIFWGQNCQFRCQYQFQTNIQFQFQCQCKVVTIWYRRCTNFVPN